VDERFARGCAFAARCRPVAFRAVALHGDDRMDDEMQRQTVPIDLHRHRVDEERHVVVDDLDDRVRRLPAVAPPAGLNTRTRASPGSRLRAKFQCESAAPYMSPASAPRGLPDRPA
jgi:hypothetical protein